jgi:hypothetical protein
MLFIHYTQAQNIKHQWAKPVGSSAVDRAYDIATNGSGDIFCTGSFENTIDLNPGSGTASHTSAGEEDIFLLKLDAQGNHLWSNRFGGLGDDMGFKLCTDPSGDVYMAGSFRYGMDLNPGSGTANVSANFSDIFVASYQGSTGNYRWGFKLGGFGDDYVTDFYFSKSGHVYVAGTIEGTVDFDPGAGTSSYTPSSSFGDAFLAKYTSTGSLVWYKTWGASTYEKLSAVGEDHNGNILMSGEFRGQIDLDPGSGQYNVSTASSNTETYLLAVNAQGNFVWAKIFAGSSNTRNTTLSTDASGNIYVSGTFSDTTDFDPDTTVAQLTSNGTSGYVLKLNNQANFEWARMFGTGANLFIESMAADSVSNIYVTGYFYGSGDFDPGPNTLTLNAANNSDGFLISLDSNGHSNWAYNILDGGGSLGNEVNSVVLDKVGNVFTTGFFTGTVDTDPESGTANLISSGNRDAFVLKFEACNSFSELNITTCSAYTSPSGNYTWNTSGVYYDILSNSAGCDSIMKIVLNISRPSDSIVISACEPYTSVSGQLWTSSGIYTDTLTTASGCDSLLVVDLNVTQIDTSVSLFFGAIQANDSNATYQWVNCQNNYASISGANNRIFTPTANGTYAVILTNNGCSDTSYCYSLMDIGLVEKGIPSFEIYPNPIEDRFFISTTDNLGHVDVKIMKTGGQILYKQGFLRPSRLEIPFMLVPGYYILEITTQRGYRKVFKIVKL